MITQRVIGLVAAGILCLTGLIGPRPAMASEPEPELALIDLVHSDYKFPSGFQWKLDCSDLLVVPEIRLQRELKTPITEFNRLPLEQKIKSLHSAADIIFRSFAEDVKAGPDPIDLKPLAEAANVISLRLKFLSESSGKKLSANARELMVIKYKLGIYFAFADRFSEDVRGRLKKFAETVITLKPEGPEERVDHDLRALAYANAAVLVASRLDTGSRTKSSIMTASSYLIESLKEDQMGHILAPALDGTLMVIFHVVTNIPAIMREYSPFQVDETLLGLIRPLTPLLDLATDMGADSGNYSRLQNSLNQLDNILSTPAFAFLAKSKAELEAIRAGYEAPKDKNKLQ